MEVFSGAQTDVGMMAWTVMADDTSRSRIVLHLCTELSVGGAENHLLMLLGALARDGRYQPHIAAFRDAVGEMRSLRTDFEAAGVPVHILRQNHVFDIRGFVRLQRLLCELRPAVLHTHLFRGDVFGPPIGKLSGVPVRVSTVHNVEQRFSSRLFRPLFRFGYHSDHCVIAISDAVARALRESLGLPEPKIRRIYYGFDPAVRWQNQGLYDLRPQFGVAPDDFVIGTIGRISSQKGHMHLVEALHILKDDLPNARLLIVGTPEPDGAYERVSARVNELHLEDAVVFSGYRDDIRSVLAAMDIFVLPSLWEGLGLVLLEAMSEKKPIVASRVPAIQEIVEDGVQGLLVPPADAHTLADAILHLAVSHDLRARMAAAGPARVEQFSIARMVNETIALYDSLIAQCHIPQTQH